MLESPDSKGSTAPAWTRYWLALLAPLYVISPLALLALPALKALPRPALWLLGFYALSQQLPALFTPDPVLSNVLALARTFLLLGLIGVGVWLQDTRDLRPLSFGLVVVIMTSFVYSLVTQIDFFVGRLTHPYMTAGSLALAGALGVWLACFVSGSLSWRVPLGVLSLTGLVLSGGRGGLAAMLVGCLAGFMLRRGRRFMLLALTGIILAGSAAMLGERLNLGFITRFSTTDTTGRDVVWSNTLSVIHAYPWTGVGTYRLGRHLSPPGQPCPLFTPADGSQVTCPALLEQLGSPWLIAHNVTLQQLAETGPLGLLGLMALLGVALYTALKRRNALGSAVIIGLLVSNVTDNTTLVPSAFFAEIFWVVVGMQLRHVRELNLKGGLVSAGLATLLSAPLVMTAMPTRPIKSAPAVLRMINASETVSSSRNYRVFLMPELPSGRYRAVLKSCTLTCVTISSITFWQSQQPRLVSLQGDLRPEPQQLKLQLLPGSSGFKTVPLAERQWSVRVRP